MAEPLVIEARIRDELSRPLHLIRGEMAGVAREADKVGRSAGGTASAGLSRMEDRTRRLQRELLKVHGHLRTVSGWLGNQLVAGARRGAFALTALIGVIGGFGARAASQFQQSQLAFETLLGSAEKGRALFAQLQQLNLKTPFELGDIAPATQLLLRYGVAGDQVVGVLKSIMDAAALSGNPAENLQRISLAVGQIIQKGKVSGEEARQLAEAGIDAYGLMAAKLGKTRAEVIKLGEAGKLSADVFVEGLVNMEGPLANLEGGAEKMSKTLLGQLSNLKDAVTVRLAEAAAPLVDTLTAQIPAITAAVGTAVDVVGPPVFRLIGLLATGLSRLLPIIAPLLGMIVGQLERLVMAAAPALTALEPLSGQIGAALVELVDALVPVMPDLVGLFVALVQVLPDFIRLLADLVPVMGMFARLATDLLGYEPVRQILAGLLVVLVGYRALSGVIGAMVGFANALRGIAAAQTEANVAAAGGGAGGRGMSGRTMAGLAGLGITAAQLPGAVQGQSAAQDLGFIASAAGTGFALGGPWGAAAGGAIGVGGVAGRRIAEWFGGDVAGNLGASARVHGLAAGRTAGRSAVTSSLRNYALAGPGSGHARGTAWDVRADFPHAYANNIRAMGGYAAVHDAGGGRHVHAQIGDSSPPPGSMVGAGGGGWDGPPVQVIIERAYGSFDVERAVQRGVARGYDEKRRRDMERARVDRLGSN